MKSYTENRAARALVGLVHQKKGLFGIAELASVRGDTPVHGANPLHPLFPKHPNQPGTERPAPPHGFAMSVKTQERNAVKSG